MSADILAATVKYLADNGDIAALVDGRVFGMTVPRLEIGRWGSGSTASPRASILLSPSGRVSSVGDNSYVPVRRMRLDAKCYGATPLEARKLGEVVNGIFKSMRPSVVTLVDGDVRLHNATFSGGDFGLVDPDADWPFWFCAWAVHAYEREVPAVPVS